jgi:hypothetical protein
MCQKTGKPCEGKCKDKEGAGGAVDGDKPPGQRPLHIVAQRAQWFKPTSMDALYALLKQYKDANYRLVFGNTGYGENLGSTVLKTVGRLERRIGTPATRVRILNRDDLFTCAVSILGMDMCAI